MATLKRARSNKQRGNAVIEYVLLLVPAILCVAIALQEMTNSMSSKLQVAAYWVGGGTETTDDPLPSAKPDPDKEFP
jgi:hypothetical protein